MSLSRHTERIYIDPYDLRGAIHVLCVAGAAEDLRQRERDMYLGAAYALSIIAEQDDVRDQSVFVEIFDNKIHGRYGDTQE